MSKIEDFENAPIGATANRGDGVRALKMDDSERGWIIPRGEYLSDEELELRGFTLDPLDAPAPATAREALDLAWELAHEVKPGQFVPDGARVLEFSDYGIKEYTVQFGLEINAEFAPVFRTVEPLPDPEPDWLEAPAVMARLDEWDRDELDVFTPAHEREGRWVVAFSALTHHWSDLRDVSPLYPKEDA